MCALVAVLLAWSFRANSKFDQIQLGMTRDQVEELLGGGQAHFPPPLDLDAWDSTSEYIVVSFDPDGRVIKKTRTEYTLIQTARICWWQCFYSVAPF
jgi:hypothetical protein